MFAMKALFLLIYREILIKCVSEGPWTMIDSHVNNKGTKTFNMVLQYIILHQNKIRFLI